MTDIDLSGKKVAILVDDRFEQAELTGPKQALEAAGATVHIVSDEAGKELRGVNHLDPGDEFKADAGMSELNVDEYDALVVPGGVVNSDYLRMKQPARELVRAFNDAGKPLAVICHGPWLLVSAGLAGGRKLTSYHTLQDDIRNAGGQWLDEEVVVDGNLITSRSPDDIPAFNAALIEKLASSGS